MPTNRIAKSLALSCVLAALVINTAQAQFAKAEDAIKYRKSGLFMMGQNFNRVAAMATGRAPFDAKLAVESASNAEVLSRMPWAGFGEGTDKGDTKAKSEIWTQKTKFMELAEKLEQDMTKLNVAAKTGNLEAIKTAVSATASNCKNCHDNFRN